MHKGSSNVSYETSTAIFSTNILHHQVSIVTKMTSKDLTLILSFIVHTSEYAQKFSGSITYWFPHNTNTREINICRKM